MPVFFESRRGADAIAFDSILRTYCHAHEVNIQAMRPRLTSIKHIKRSKRLRHEFFHHFSFEIHPQKLTCPIEMNYLNRKCIFQPLIFSGHVSFPGSNSLDFAGNVHVVVFKNMARNLGVGQLPPADDWNPKKGEVGYLILCLWKSYAEAFHR